MFNQCYCCYSKPILDVADNKFAESAAVLMLTVHIHVSMYPSIHYRHILVPLCLCIHVFVYLFIHVSRICLLYFCIQTVYTVCVFMYPFILIFIILPIHITKCPCMYLHSCNRVSMYPHRCTVYLCALLSQVVLI